jgi:photosystem II stability/assembly factor-like uncharacterized protein
MKTLKIFVLFFITSFLTSAFSQSGWQIQTSNTSQNLNKLYFLNTSTGWVVGDGATILKTTNGGINWVPSSYFGGGTLFSVYFKNQSSGLIGGYHNGHLDGFMIRTLDGGNSWGFNNFTGEPYCIFSFGGDTVWSSRHDGYVMKSYDFGNTWTSSFILDELELYTVFFINNLTGWTGGAVFQGQAYIYKTTNGGNSWFNQLISATNHFYSIHFLNANTGFAASLGGAVFKTTNGGNSWQVILPNTGFTLFGIQSISPGICYAVGDNSRIFKSTNEGTTWALQQLPTGINYTIFSAIQFKNVSTGWVIGSLGTILKTTNGGELIGVQNIGTSIPNEYELYQNYPNPFNPATTIEFDIPKAVNVTIAVYDIRGKEIEQLVNENLQPGSYKTIFDAGKLSSGIYFYRITAGDFIQTKKLSLIK